MEARNDKRTFQVQLTLTPPMPLTLSDSSTIHARASIHSSHYLDARRCVRHFVRAGDISVDIGRARRSGRTGPRKRLCARLENGVGSGLRVSDCARVGRGCCVGHPISGRRAGSGARGKRGLEPERVDFFCGAIALVVVVSGFEQKLSSARLAKAMLKSRNNRVRILLESCADF